MMVIIHNLVSVHRVTEKSRVRKRHNTIIPGNPEQVTDGAKHISTLKAREEEQKRRRLAAEEEIDKVRKARNQLRPSTIDYTSREG